MKINAFVHIGMGKCGSSALQTALSHNPTLESSTYGTLQYCHLSREGKIEPVRQLKQKLPAIPHGYIASSPGVKFALNPDNLRTSRAVVNGISTSGAVILSHESWAHTLPIVEETGLFEALGLNAHAIAYVRPPVEWINSAWWQWGAWSGRDFDPWLHSIIPATQWSRLLAPWRDARGVSCLNVRLLDDDIVADFCKLLDTEALPHARRNTGLPGEMLRFMQNHPQFRKGPHDAKNDHIFARRLRGLKAGNTPWVLNRQQTQIILDETRNSNLKLMAMLDEESQAIMRKDTRWWEAAAFAEKRIEEPGPVAMDPDDLDRLAGKALQAIVEMDEEFRQRSSRSGFRTVFRSVGSAPVGRVLADAPADRMPMVMKDYAPHTIVFHPGIGKTATSAIQRTGLALPVSDPDSACFAPVGVLGAAHNVFASIHPMFDPEVFERSLQELIAFTRKRNAPTVVSSEFLMRERPEKIQALTAALSSAGIHCKAIFGIREYDGFLMSAYMQALKVGWGMRENETLEDYAEREMRLIRYPELVDRWARCIGDNNVFLIDYDKNKEQFLSIFFGFLNLSSASIPEVTETVNPSLPIGAAEIVRSFDLACDDEIARRKLIEHLMRLTFKPGIEASLRQCVGQVTGDKYAQDHAWLSERYTWLGP